MGIAINTALSGLTAATQRLNTSAQNIANADSTQTDQNGTTVNAPYVPQQVVQSSQATGGVTTQVEPVNPPAIQLYDPGNAAANASGIAQYPNVDPAQQLVQAQLSSYDAQGNINVIKVQEQMFQSVLNIVS